MKNQYQNQHNKHKHYEISLEPQEDVNATPQDSQKQRKRPVLHRLTSLTDDEKYALTSLLIDSTHIQPKTLTKELLLTTPYATPGSNDNYKLDISTGKIVPQLKPTTVQVHNCKVKRRRNSNSHIGQWRAHEIGILHKALRKGSSLFQKRSSRVKSSDVAKGTTQTDISPLGSGGVPNSKVISLGDKDQTNVSVVSSESLIGAGSSARTDLSQCQSKADGDDGSISSTSSWGDNPVEHYDSWQLLNDEYADDYGFGYQPDLGSLDEGSRRSFEILGTSADDVSASPHVLSPPLMESLLSFVPESLSCENWWLKYSLVRDGASLETLRNYTKAAQNTVIAIQTTSGCVFGCFTGSPWRIDHGYFGSGEAFVWRMRYNKFLKCVSLYDQGTMESIVDVYPFSGLNKSVQLCHQDFLAVGGGEVESALVHDDDLLKHILKSGQKQELGFAIALHGDLQRGTSSPSSTFCNPKLTGEEDGIFEIANLEVWTLTPCTTVQDAEQLEMRKYFLHEKLNRSNVSSLSSMGSTESPTSPYTSQRAFYHRLGEDGDEQLRDRWNLASIQSESALNTLSGKSPRFVT
jgi:hypothetical protein